VRTEVGGVVSAERFQLVGKAGRGFNVTPLWPAAMLAVDGGRPGLSKVVGRYDMQPALRGPPIAGSTQNPAWRF
jgi:hypothetical protein